MNKRDFNRTINQVTTKKSIDIFKVNQLPDQTKDELLQFIVRYRGPVLKEFVTDNTDFKWLYACGYLYETKRKQYTFIHTAEHRIK